MLPALLGRLCGEPLEILDLRPHPLQSSCPLTIVSLRYGSGSRRLLLKDLGRRSPSAGPRFLYDPYREIAAYRWLGRRLGVPGFLGAHVERERGICWLFCEHVEGVPLWQSNSRERWCEAAELLAELHELRSEDTRTCWMRYDERYFAWWMPRAQAFSPESGMGRLRGAHAAAVARLLRAPAVTLHGDYYPSNVLVAERPGSPICPLDFELAGIGPAALDLAALCTGLPHAIADELLEAYRSRRSDAEAREELDELLVCARLHLAIRWLGWTPTHRPPSHQRFDWTAEAHRAAEELEARTTLGVAA
jgi:aminoglycoside phosphotransferase (APT) family kinase protein